MTCHDNGLVYRTSSFQLCTFVFCSYPFLNPHLRTFNIILYTFVLRMSECNTIKLLPQCMSIPIHHILCKLPTVQIILSCFSLKLVAFCSFLDRGNSEWVFGNMPVSDTFQGWRVIIPSYNRTCISFPSAFAIMHIEKDFLLYSQRLTTFVIT